MARLIPQKQIEEVNQFKDSVGVSGSLVVSQSFDLGSDPTEPSSLTGDITISGSLNISGAFSLEGDTVLNATASTAQLSLDTQLFDGIASEDFGAQKSVIYVSATDGLDANDGRTLQYPVRTIGKALEIVSASVAEDEDRGDDGRFGLDSGSNFSGFRVEVAAGTYREDNPLTVPPNTTIWGDGQRVTKVLNNDEVEDLFWVDSGVYLGEMTFGGMRLDSLADATKGFAVAFKPNAFITTSPYVQNCALISNQENSFLELYEDIPKGGGGINVDGDRVNPNSPLASMVLDAYTQVSPNGIGCQVNGRGFIQLVSFFTNFSAYGVKVLNGGQAVLLNSNTSFGDFGLYSSGSRFITGSGGNLDAFNTVQDNYSIIINTIENGLTAIPAVTSSTEEARKVSGSTQEFISGFSSASVADTAVTKFEIVESIVSGSTFTGSVVNNNENFVKATSENQEFSLTFVGTAIEVTSVSSSFALIRDIIEDGETSESLVRNSEGAITVTGTSQVTGSGVTDTSIQPFVSQSFYFISDSLLNGTGSLPSPTPYGTPRTGSDITETYDLLKDNIPFIQDEVIAYISSSWSEFTYNEDSCSRDIGLIVSGAAEDLLYGEYSASIVNAKRYYEVPSDVTGSQLYPTLHAINYAQGITEQIIDGVEFVQPSFEVTASVDLLNKNKEFIKAETIAYISSSWSELVYNEMSCSRDVGYLIDAAKTDLLYGGNERSIIAGDFYYMFPSNAIGSGSTPNEQAQLQPTLDGVFFAGEMSQDVIQNIEYLPPSQEVQNGVELLRLNREFIQENVIAYISSSWSEFDYNEMSCSRDVGLIVDAVATDTFYGGNLRSVTAGEFYYDIPSVATSEQKPQTLDGIRFAKGTAENVINQVQYTLPTFLNRESVGILLDRKEEIKTRAIDFANNAFPDFVYNEASCSRDTGYIIDALATDILYGGNERSVEAAESYYNGVYGDASEVINEQKEETAETNRFLRTVIGNIVRNARLEEFGSLCISTSHDFSYAGSGVTYKALPPNQGGNGVPDPDKEITELGGGRVFFTSGNELGDFRIGGGLVINQATGTLQGRTFSRSLFTLVTPFSLALQD